VRGRKFLENRLCGDQRIAAVVAFPGEHEHPAVRREAANLLDIAKHGDTDGAAGALHGGPLPDLVAGEERGFERARGLAAQDRMAAGDHGCRGATTS
jgi:hypothetical protein